MKNPVMALEAAQVVNDECDRRGIVAPDDDARAWAYQVAAELALKGFDIEEIRRVVRSELDAKGRPEQQVIEVGDEEAPPLEEPTPEERAHEQLQRFQQHYPADEDAPPLEDA